MRSQSGDKAGYLCRHLWLATVKKVIRSRYNIKLFRRGKLLDKPAQYRQRGERVVLASNEQLGFDGETAARNFWTDEERTFGPDGIYEVLPGRTARLYEVR